MKRVNLPGLTNRYDAGDDEGMTEFEQQLRSNARLALVVPSPHVRERTLAALRMQPRIMAVTRRPWVMPALAACLLMAISAGIGLFLGLLALKDCGLVVADKETLVTLGDLKSPSAESLR